MHERPISHSDPQLVSDEGLLEPPSQSGRGRVRDEAALIERLAEIVRPTGERWLHVMDLFIPEQLEHRGHEEMRRARLALSIISVCIIITASSLILDLSTGISQVSLAKGVLFTACAALLPLMRYSGSSRLVSNLFVLSYFFFVAGIAGATGIGAPLGVLGSIAIPPVAVLLCGLRAGFFWLVVAAGLPIGLIAATQLGVAFPVTPDPLLATRKMLSGSLILTLGMGAGALCFEFWRRRAVAEAMDARREAELAQERRATSEEQFRDHLEALVAERTHELEGSREQLLQSERLAAVGTMAAGIAHQINNPIGSILASAEYALLCEDDGAQAEDEPSLRELLDEIVEQSQRCGRIVRSILQFSRNDATEKWACAIEDVVNRSCNLTRRSASQLGVQFELEAEAGLPSVLMNPIEIEQVVVNLLNNAIQSGARLISVQLKWTPEKDRVAVAIRDDGCGIDEATLPKVFDPFFTTRVTKGGSGLGLSVAHGIVGSHGGIMTVESEVGAGTTVGFALPIQKD